MEDFEADVLSRFYSDKQVQESFSFISALICRHFLRVLTAISSRPTSRSVEICAPYVAQSQFATPRPTSRSVKICAPWHSLRRQPPVLPLVRWSFRRSSPESTSS